MEPQQLLSFAAIALTLIAAPGPDWAFVLAAGAGARVVIPAVVGILSGYGLITAAVAGGVGTLVADQPMAMLALTVTGAAYLIYLGFRTLRSGGGISHAQASVSSVRRAGHLFIRGIAVSTLNPKGLLIFVSILPQFTRSPGWPLPVQLALLGATFILICAAFYLPLGYASGRVLSAKPRVAQVTTKIAGSVMLVAGAAFLVEWVVRYVSA